MGAADRLCTAHVATEAVGQKQKETQGGPCGEYVMVEIYY